MIVVFSSACVKKSLLKTRRVLDSFAQRINDRVWVTTITENGLDAIKQLLNNSASKNTCVCCYRITSRRTFKVEWIVGKKDIFNNGWYPTNYTNGEFNYDDER